ncbi:MAG: plastocyanin/azurin family copper-binding protein [Nitrospiria bacterium]
MRERSARWALAGLAAGWLALGASSSPAADGHQIVIEPETYLFAPQALSIRQGDTVAWTNRDGQMHMVVTSKPDSNGQELEIYARLNPGETFKHQFNSPAAYYYFCAVHFQMWGIISVNP